MPHDGYATAVGRVYQACQGGWTGRGCLGCSVCVARQAGRSSKRNRLRACNHRRAERVPPHSLTTRVGWQAGRLRGCTARVNKYALATDGKGLINCGTNLPHSSSTPASASQPGHLRRPAPPRAEAHPPTPAWAAASASQQHPLRRRPPPPAGGMTGRHRPVTRTRGLSWRWQGCLPPMAPCAAWRNYYAWLRWAGPSGQPGLSSAPL